MHTGCWWENLRERTINGRPRHRWEYNNKMYFQEVVCEVMDWIDVV